MSDPLEGDSATPNIPGMTGRNSSGGDGVFGAGTDGTGVHGENNRRGVVVSHGFIAGTDSVHGEDVGVYGESSKQGVLGHSDIGTGVLGHTNSGFGIRGESSNGSGFIGGADPIRHQDAGVYGESKKQGVLGHSDVGIGVLGHTNSGFAICGESASGKGFIGGIDPVSRQRSGIYGESDQCGVLGRATAAGAVGVNGTSQAANGVGIQGQSIGPGLAGKFIGDVELDGVLQVPADDGLHINAASVRIHGSDLLLDGRSGQERFFRALVDMGNKLVLNFNGDYGEGVEVESDLVLDGVLQVPADDGLHINAASVRIHGSDLLLDGRSGQDHLFRALVDMGNKLIINFNGDYDQGVEVGSDLVVDGTVRSLGADCAEQFDLATGTAGEPGTVMVIGADGKLEPCVTTYDAKVAGVVSGAGVHKTAFVLNDQAGHRAAIALIGSVYCKVDASCAPISAGDLLTTSTTPGHAMKAVDADRSSGAIVGKALQPLAGGTGLIHILVAPQ